MIGLQLPHDRAMTPDEARGFRMGMAAIATWTDQLARSSRRLADASPIITPQSHAEFTARAVASMAQALDRTLGRGGSAQE